MPMKFEDIKTASREALAEELAAAGEYTGDWQTATMEELRDGVERSYPYRQFRPDKKQFRFCAEADFCFTIRATSEEEARKKLDDALLEFLEGETVYAEHSEDARFYTDLPNTEAESYKCELVDVRDEE